MLHLGSSPKKFFNTPPRCNSTFHVCVCTQWTFPRNTFSLCLRWRVFSRTLGCGARRRLACTPRRKRESRPGSVACDLGVQKSRNLTNNRGEGFRRARAKQVHGNPELPHFSVPIFFTAAASRCLSSTAPALEGSIATVQEQQRFKL